MLASRLGSPAVGEAVTVRTMLIVGCSQAAPVVESHTALVVLAEAVDCTGFVAAAALPQVVFVGKVLERDTAAEDMSTVVAAVAGTGPESHYVWH